MTATKRLDSNNFQSKLSVVIKSFVLSHARIVILLHKQIYIIIEAMIAQLVVYTVAASKDVSS